MKQLALDGTCEFSVGADSVELRIGRITNNRAGGASGTLAVRLWALQGPAQAGKLNGVVVASEKLPSLHGGQSVRDLVRTLAPTAVPSGYYHAALTLEEYDSKSPNQWYIMDMVTFDEPAFFGKRLSVEAVTVNARSAGTLVVDVGEIRNETQEPMAALRVSVWAARDPYSGGAIKGFRLGVKELDPLGGGDSYRDLSWTLERPAASGAARVAVVLFEERLAGAERFRMLAYSSVELASPDQPAEVLPATVGAPPGIAEPAISEKDLIGQAQAKTALKEVIALARINEERRRRGLAVPRVTLHAAFTGSPGTGKTTFARFYTQQISALGLLKRGHLVEVSRSDLVAEFSGQTAPRTAKAVKAALGGVLFVDEAYALKTGKEDGYGQECIDTLVKLMEDHREELVVIFAGYSTEMREFLRQNSGLESRVPHVIEFEDFDDAQLGEILDSFCRRAGVAVTESLRDTAVEQISSRRRGRSFGNARDVRNVFERALARQAVRLQQADVGSASSEQLSQLVPQDFAPGASEAVKADRDGSDALGKVDSLIGLENVKRDMRETAALARVERARHRGAGLPSVPLNRLYAGEAGTGKRTVARHYAAFLRERRLLSRGHIVEVSRADFVAGYIGQTSEKTRKRIEEAMGGLLYVLDAPSLWLRGDKYEVDAVDALLSGAESNRDKLVIVLSGDAADLSRVYHEDARVRRIFPLPLQFATPAKQDLFKIGLRMAEAGGYTLTGAAQDALRKLIEVERGANAPGGNAYYVRDVLEQAYKQRALRLERMGDPATLASDLLHRLEAEDFGEERRRQGSGDVRS